MDKEITALDITGVGERKTLVPVAKIKTTLISMRNLGIAVKARNENGIPMIEFGSRRVHFELPHNGTTRKLKRVRLRALVKEINSFVKKIDSKLGITIVEGRPKIEHLSWKCNYIHRSKLKNHFH